MTGLIIILTSGGAAPQTTTSAPASQPMDSKAKLNWSQGYRALCHEFAVQDGKYTRLTPEARLYFLESKRAADSVMKQFEDVIKFCTERLKSASTPEAKRTLRMLITEARRVITETRRWQQSISLVPTSLLMLPKVTTLSMGSIGRLSCNCRILEVVGESELRVELDDPFKNQDVWLSGWATGDLLDDDKGAIDSLVRIMGPKEYTTVLGANRRVILIEAIDMKPYFEGMSEESFAEMLSFLGWADDQFAAKVEAAQQKDRRTWFLDVGDQLEKGLLDKQAAAKADLRRR